MGTDSAPMISFDPPTRPRPEHQDQFELATHLRGRFHEISARFLITELEAGLALLDVADTSQNGGFKERRRAWRAKRTTWWPIGSLGSPRSPSPSPSRSATRFIASTGS